MDSIKGKNWAEAWAQHFAKSSYKNRILNNGVSSETYWDNYTWWQKLQSYTNYPGEALDRILRYIDETSTVLDIGAGSGAFAVPIAGVAAEVTALEPSLGQVDRLREEADKAGVKNIKVIKQRWEDVRSQDIGKYDVVIAAYCFQMEDIESALRKMCEAARKDVFLIHIADHDLVAPLVDIIDYEVGPDYTYLYNLLCEMGYNPTVELLRRVYQVPLDFQMEVMGYSHGLTAEPQQRLLTFLYSNDRIRVVDGVSFVCRWHIDALIRLHF